VSSMTIRYASDRDAAHLARLAALDSSRVPDGALLLAFVDGELWAAVAIARGVAIADPFRPSGPVVELLRARARQLVGDAPRRWRRPGLARAPQAVASMFNRT
jgi:predicted transcriptional regulator